MHLALANVSVLYGAQAPTGFGMGPPTNLIQPCFYCLNFVV